MNGSTRSVVCTAGEGPEAERLLLREWLVTNGLGGYASGTVSGVITRRYHGLLAAALPARFGRMIMLSDIDDVLRFSDGETVRLGGEETGASLLRMHCSGYLKEFHLERGLPVWRYEIRGMTIEKRVYMVYRQNTVYVSYRVLSGGGESVRLEIRPAMNFRSHEDPVDIPVAGPVLLTVREDRYEFSMRKDYPRLRMYIYGDRPAFTYARMTLEEVVYRVEEGRGYAGRGDLWSPGYFRAMLSRDREVSLVASTESWETVDSLDPREALESEHRRRRGLVSTALPPARTGLAEEMVYAADQFVVLPPGRREDQARAHAAGQETRTVIAGYPWFTDWGRDTMISLEGLTLMTGRKGEAEWILRTFAQHIRDGLIPNLFPEGEKEGLYHTADATLWFFHAVDRYVGITGDRGILDLMVPKLRDVVECHLAGTRFGIRVDDGDGLLTQGAPGYQLTWMDAKVGDWVVTPRRGKAVELNALWYNALRIFETWLRSAGDTAGADRYAACAARTLASFNRRFWYEGGGYLYDVVDGEDGDDVSCRPNQVFAISLKHPVLDRRYWEPVMRVVEERLLTPVGLRSLASGSPDYKPRYYGDRRARDAAYHQGTVWAWLIGPFIDAWLKLHPEDPAGARRFLSGFSEHMNEGCIGSVSEVFDADPPFEPRGCFAQAWSVAEVLRSLVRTDAGPRREPVPAGKTDIAF